MEHKSQYNGVRPHKSLGQNFLTDSSIADSIVDVANIHNKDLVLEIGPGTGVLTSRILEKGAKLVVFEFDPGLADRLNLDFAEAIRKDQLEIVVGDCLKTLPDWLYQHQAVGSYKLISNLPYQITTPVFRMLFEGGVMKTPELIVLMLQKELVDRLLAGAGLADRGYLSVYLEYWAQAERLLEAPRKAFWPAPKVDSSVIRLQLRADRAYLGVEERKFMKFVRAGFVAKRKLLYKVLTGLLDTSRDEVNAIFAQHGLSTTARSQELSLTQWQALYQEFKQKRGHHE